MKTFAIDPMLNAKYELLVSITEKLMRFRDDGDEVNALRYEKIMDQTASAIGYYVAAKIEEITLR